MNRGDYAKFVFVFTLSYVILRYTLGYLLMGPTAGIVGHLVGCSTEGNRIICGFDAYEIVPECTGIVSLSLFIAFLSVIPFDRRKLLRTVLFGSLFLYLLNVLRVYSLIVLAGSVFSFSLVHAIFWLVTPVLTVLYVLWLRK